MSVEATESLSSSGVNVYYPGLQLLPSMIAVASLVDGSERLELLNEASLILDELISRLKSHSYSRALDAIGYPLVDVFELIEVLGVENLEEILAYAVNLIEGNPAERPESLEVYTDLLGWSMSPEELDRETLGYAIILSFTASFNKALNRIALDVNNSS